MDTAAENMCWYNGRAKRGEKKKKILALNAGKEVAASHPQHNSAHNTPILKQRLFNSNTTFIFTAGCHRQNRVWNMYASHMQTHYNVLESCRLFMISLLVCGMVSTIQSRANIFSIRINITLAFLSICTCEPSPHPLLSVEACAVKVCRSEGNHATVLASLLAVTQNATSPTMYHESFRSVNKEMERAKGARTGRRLCCCDTHSEQYGTRTHIHMCTQTPARASTHSITLSVRFRLHHFYSAAAYIISSNPYWSDVSFTSHTHLMWEYGHILQWRNTHLLDALWHSSH